MLDIYVEVALLDNAVADPENVCAEVETFIKSLPNRIFSGSQLSGYWNQKVLIGNVKSIRVADIENADADDNHYGNCSNSFDPSKDVSNSRFHIHTFHLMNECSAVRSDNESNDILFSEKLLPSAEYESLWDTLVFDTDLKTRLLQYSQTSLLFADKQVNTSVIGLNRVILLHGEPGTGKTTLCKSLAQKVTIRLSDRFNYGFFIEVHTQSLFSKYFSESGKMLMKMFEKINEHISNKDALVFVLIDEVESIAASRSASISGSEPSDSLRVVNSLLTQIDRLKQESNCLILTTSNFSEAIDLAFIDRADLKIHVGLPSTSAIYGILASCVVELSRVRLICPPVDDLLDAHAVRLFEQLDTVGQEPNDGMGNGKVSSSRLLWKISAKCQGMSGRALRKLPFLAFMKCGKRKMGLTEFVRTLQEQCIGDAVAKG